MVNDEGQLYTLEGIAAAVIIIVTMYLVLGTTAIYTPGDTHITDMQMEQIGSDVLKMMDTPYSIGLDSELVACVKTTDNTRFSANFTKFLSARAQLPDDTNIHFNATVYYRDQTPDPDVIGSYPLSNSGQAYAGRDPAVRVTRWVQVPQRPTGPPGVVPAEVDNRPQAMLVEVLLWRG